MVGLVMSGPETAPSAKSAAIIVEDTRISLFVWIEDINNSISMDVCTIYRFITLVFSLSMVMLTITG
jgi:hypothetical protein